jgi:hypothetical protein
MQKVLKFVTSILCFYGWCVNFRANFRATNEVIFSYYLTGSRCNIRKQFSNLLDFIHSRTTLFTKFAICLTWMVRSLKRETKNNFQLSILCNSGCAWFWARFYFTTESCVLWVQFIHRKLSEMTFSPNFCTRKKQQSYYAHRQGLRVITVIHFNLQSHTWWKNPEKPQRNTQKNDAHLAQWYTSWEHH